MNDRPDEWDQRHTRKTDCSLHPPRQQQAGREKLRQRFPSNKFNSEPRAEANFRHRNNNYNSRLPAPEKVLSARNRRFRMPRSPVPMACERQAKCAGTRQQQHAIHSRQRANHILIQIIHLTRRRINMCCGEIGPTQITRKLQLR